MVGRIDIPTAWQSKAPETREDLRRVRQVLERLRADMADLQTQIDNLPTGGGGSGTVDSVVEGDGIDVDATDPANPEVSVEWGTGANQVRRGNDAAYTDARTPTGAAGGDLSGTYPNPTIPSLARLRSEIWFPPASADAFDEEFEGSLGGMTWWEGDPSTGTGVLSSITGSAGTVDDVSADPSSSNVRYSVTRRTSWLQWNVPISAANRQFALKQVGTLGTDDSFSCRINPLVFHDSNINNSYMLGLIIMADSGGAPSREEWVSVQIDTDPSQYAAVRMLNRSGGGAQTTRPSGTAQTYTAMNNISGSVVVTPWQYLGIRKRGSNWCIYTATDGFVRTSVEFSGPSLGTSPWVGFMSWRSTSSDFKGVFSADYLRRGTTLPW